VTIFYLREAHDLSVRKILQELVKMGFHREYLL
jgi:hypothetical protein